MTNLQVGDYIHHRANNTLWHVLVINPDGSLQVEFYAGYKGNNKQCKTIRRAEEYRKCLMTTPTGN